MSNASHIVTPSALRPSLAAFVALSVCLGVIWAATALVISQLRVDHQVWDMHAEKLSLTRTLIADLKQPPDITNLARTEDIQAVLNLGALAEQCVTTLGRKSAMTLKLVGADRLLAHCQADTSTARSLTQGLVLGQRDAGAAGDYASLAFAELNGVLDRRIAFQRDLVASETRSAITSVVAFLFALAVTAGTLMLARGQLRWVKTPERRAQPRKSGHAHIASPTANLDTNIDEMLDVLHQLGQLGAWQLDVTAKPYAMMWTEQVREIMEVQDDFSPSYEAGIAFFTPSSRPVLKEAVERGIQTQTSWELELPAVTAKRRQIWVRVCARPMHQDGQLIGFVGAIRDVTQQRSERDALSRSLTEADDALQQLSAYQSALDTVAIVSIADAKGDIIFANDNFCAVSGYGRDELLGCNHRIVNSGHHDRAFFVEMWRTIAKGQIWRADVCNRAKDGSLYWVDTTIVPSLGPDGRPERYISIRYEITEQRLADERMRSALTELEGFFNVSLDLLCILDRTGKVLRVSKAVEDELGHSLDTIAGNDLGAFVHADDIEPTLNILENLASGAEVSVFTNRFKHADGTWRIMEWRGQALNGAIYVAGRDITANVAYEDELREQRQQAEGLAELKSQFLATMSHEIRTPLNGLLGMVDIVLRGDLAEEQQRRLKSASESGWQLLAVLNDILDLSKIESGQFTIEDGTYSPRDSLKNVFDLLDHEADKKGLRLWSEFDDTVPEMVHGDPARVRQILLNLISNAIKFTEKGGVSVSVSTQKGTNGTAQLRFSVTDSGIGIAQDAVASLFDRFTQAESSTTRKYGGTGLGLAICKELTQLMGGDITVESHIGRGSTFSFTVDAPACASAIGAQSQGEGDADGDAETDLGSFKILVAEDNARNQDVIRMVLSVLEHDVTIVSDGVEAVEAAAKTVYDVILMDVRMPNMDGLDATRTIRASQGGSSRTPILALTAGVMTEEREEIMTCGMNGVVLKPIKIESLAEAMASAVLEHRQWQCAETDVGPAPNSLQ